ncbi:MAG TPA: acetyl-CoA decarbonylase/synthase complex subunit alpha/beta [Terriglobales bacterium]|nr:acetyl-CoA decarbonylase/synthase complex subunit alpha/beta [Terriglobales bacterium]
MSKIISSSAIRGAHQIVRDAEDYLARAVAAKGADCAVGFPDTAYSLPVIYSLLGERVDKLSDMRKILDECHRLLPEIPSENLWLPYLGDTLDAGAATLFAFEIIEACKYLIGPNPIDGIWLGAANDVIIRERGVEFVDGSAPGFAAVVGAAPTIEDAVRIARELQEKNLYVFIAGHTKGVSFAEQLAEAGVEMGWETRLVPYGKEISAAIYALGFANRVALSFGGVKPGEYERNLKYNKNRTFAFVMALGEVTEEKYAAAAGAINYGFPTIADTDIPQILPTGICTYEHVVSSVPIDRIVEKCLEVRGCKIKVAKVPIPVAYGAAFEGERIRKEQTYLEFGGNRTPGFEYCTTLDLADVEDGKIEVIGPEIDDVVIDPASTELAALPIGIWVEVAGRKMQPDFEPILERQIHHLINGAEGIWHMGQRDINWIRISKAAKDKGFKIRHLGEILHAKFLNDYPAIVDKVQVKIFTTAKDVEERIDIARHAYRARNARMESLTDESVDTFYSCLLCQSFAPNHVCVITPERLGLCGAYNWLDGKAAYEIDPTGPNQPLVKGECLDPVRGQWVNINDYVYANSKQTLPRFNAYSMLEDPMTSCGCFEAIVCLMTEANGVMIVNREYLGETPAGMKFSTMANTAGGGQQVPGFIGVGKAYVTSRKFISAEGGIRRIVWMPKELKEFLREDLDKAGKTLGLENFTDMIADETNGTDVASVQAFMQKVNHPALTMWDITIPSEEAAAVDVQKAARSGQVVASAGGATTTTSDTAVAVAEPPASAPSTPTTTAVTAPAAPKAPVVQPAAPAPPTGAPVPQSDGVGALIAMLERLRNAPPATEIQPGMSAMEQMAALQASTAMHLLHAGANMLLMQSGFFAAAAAAPVPMSAPPMPPPGACPTCFPTEEEIASVTVPMAGPTETKPVETPARPVTSARDVPVEKSITSAAILVPKSVTIAPDKANVAVRTVTLGGTGTRTSSVTVGGAEVLPFRHYEGNVGRKPVIAMEVLDEVPKSYPDCLRNQYGDLVKDPVAWARHLVDKLGAEIISVRLSTTHPDNGDLSPEAAGNIVKDILAAVGVPIIVTGCSHFEKNNAVMKYIASTFAGENLLLNWVETDNYKTIAATVMAYQHCVVAQTPIDVNMCKQLNILLTTMGVPAERIIVDPLTSALGYGLEYTYSVMERIRTSAFTGDPMLAMPVLVNTGFEVSKIKESRAPRKDFPLWGSEEEREAFLEIATGMCYLNSGADMLLVYHPLAARTMKRKIDEMMCCAK